MDNLITIKNLKKIYKMGDEKIRALDDVNLTIREREFLCLLGTSGSGKSTLLNMIAGLEKPTAGEIIINKQKIHKMNEEQITKFRQKYVGFIFQAYNLIPTLTALENVSLGLTFQGVPKKKRDAMASEMLSLVGLGKRLHHKPTEMSGGQQQRVSIARAFVNKPSIVFADEPTGNLDTKTTYEIMDLMTNMAYEYKQTLIIVTHDNEISDYVHRIIHLKDGKIIEEIMNDSVIKNGVKEEFVYEKL